MQEDELPARGSFLFWGLDEKGRGVALRPDFRERALISPRRPDMRFELKQDALSTALASRRLLPTLYLSFAMTALARGLACAGGVFQFAYLPAMKEGTADALRRCGEHARADRLSISCPLGAGFHALRAPGAQGEDPDHAAGPLDILRHGGLSEKDWKAFGEFRTEEAFFCSLQFQYEDIIPEAERLPGWFEALRRMPSLVLQHDKKYEKHDA